MRQVFLSSRVCNTVRCLFNLSTLSSLLPVRWCVKRRCVSRMSNSTKKRPRSASSNRRLSNLDRFASYFVEFSVGHLVLSSILCYLKEQIDRNPKLIPGCPLQSVSLPLRAAVTSHSCYSVMFLTVSFLPDRVSVGVLRAQNRRLISLSRKRLCEMKRRLPLLATYTKPMDRNRITTYH